MPAVQLVRNRLFSFVWVYHTRLPIPGNYFNTCCYTISNKYSLIKRFNCYCLLKGPFFCRNNLLVATGRSLGQDISANGINFMKRKNRFGNLVEKSSAVRISHHRRQFSVAFCLFIHLSPLWGLDVCCYDIAIHLSPLRGFS